MKSLTAQLTALLRRRPARRNARILGLFLLALATIVTVYAVAFHYMMAREGQTYSWITGFYWTLTVMSTLGFGDITFHSDAGRLFSMLVLISGTLFLLVLFPFIVIQFFWAPWMEAQAAARAPRVLPEGTCDHVLLTRYDEVSAALIERLEQRQIGYTLIVPDREEAVRYHDRGLRVTVGDLDDPDTWERACVQQAGLVATTCNDFTNTNVAFTVRGVAPDVPVVATARDPASVDILELAGCTHVLELAEELGSALGRRIIGADALTHTIGTFGPLAIAEATATRTPLVGKSLAEAQLRKITGLTVVGVWERGRFSSAVGSTIIHSDTVLVLAGTREQLYRYDELFVIYNVSVAPVVILGGGSVGQATGRALAEREIDYWIIEKDPALVTDPEHHILGSAAELEVLQKAGIMETPAVIITTNDDDLNVYLAIYCRSLRPDVQIISRASLDRNVATLHRAGTDFVMSYASMGANTMLNLLKRGEILMLAEGLDLFKLPVPKSLAGRSIVEASVRERTGVSIVALARGDEIEVNPDPTRPLPEDGEILLIGTDEAEARFLETFARD